MAHFRKKTERPSVGELKEAVSQARYKQRYIAVIVNTVFTLITVAAAAVLVATLFMPVLRIYGSSMTPTLEENDIVVCAKASNFETGDLVAFYLGNKLLVKRVIAGPGDWVNIDNKGNVYVNNSPLYEPYLTEKAFGECDIDLPYQVPESTWFLMGDHRSVSIDSRNTSVGCVSADQIVGKILYCVWPFDSIRKINK